MDNINKSSELDFLKLQADKANARMNNFQEEIAAVITDYAFKHFPELKDMDAEEIHAFGNALSANTWQLTTELSTLHYNVRTKKD